MQIQRSSEQVQFSESLSPSGGETKNYTNTSIKILFYFHKLSRLHQPMHVHVHSCSLIRAHCTNVPTCMDECARPLSELNKEPLCSGLLSHNPSVSLH